MSVDAVQDRRELLLLLATGGAALAQGTRPGGPRLPEGAAVIRDLAYVTGGHERQTVDLYLPPGPREDVPLIVWIHGGAWLGGSKEATRAVAFVTDGYAVASINYRLSTHALWPAQIQDCKASIRWLRANARKHGMDASRIAVWGASAGGHLAAMLGTAGAVKEFDTGENLEVSSRVQAVCDFFGPTDFLQMDAHRVSDAAVIHNSADSPESKLLGGPIQENPEEAARANPITYITKDVPPFYIAHGDRDPLVPPHQSELLEASLRRAGVPVTLHSVKGGGHGTGFEKDPELMTEVRAFFARTLSGPPPR